MSKLRVVLSDAAGVIAVSAAIVLIIIGVIAFVRWVAEG